MSGYPEPLAVNAAAGRLYDLGPARPEWIDHVEFVQAAAKADKGERTSKTDRNEMRRQCHRNNLPFVQDRRSLYVQVS